MGSKEQLFRIRNLGRMEMTKIYTKYILETYKLCTFRFPLAQLKVKLIHIEMLKFL